MERKHYYAYNKTREAFLSLGISLVDRSGASSWSALSKRELRTNEGLWVSSTKASRNSVTYSGVCDRIYLDSALRVIALSEGVPASAAEFSSLAFHHLLLLPVHTIFASQTQIGDQVLIGTIEDIGAILEGIEPIANRPSASETKVKRRTMQAPMKWLSKIFSARDRRRSTRHSSPPLMAFYWDGGIPVPHAVPDISRTGLFVKTADRWHPRTLLRVTLQKKSNDPLLPDETITLQCRVVRTGNEGVGLAFMVAEGPNGDGQASVGRLATRKELNRFFESLVGGHNGFSSAENPFLPFPDQTPAQAPDPAASDGPNLPPEPANQNTERNTQAS